jgi:hypothetical protein
VVAERYRLAKSLHFLFETDEIKANISRRFQKGVIWDSDNKVGQNR